mmetsp:Transcript_82028/g.222726  ORF Transcript_82028/g.222726 Transcript_82028/m.222726 type:complete len:224 (-) Transcript_82028:249-920(-)
MRTRQTMTEVGAGGRALRCQWNWWSPFRRRMARGTPAARRKRPCARARGAGLPVHWLSSLRGRPGRLRRRRTPAARRKLPRARDSGPGLPWQWSPSLRGRLGRRRTRFDGEVGAVVHGDGGRPQRPTGVRTAIAPRRRGLGGVGAAADGHGRRPQKTMGARTANAPRRLARRSRRRRRRKSGTWHSRWSPSLQGRRKTGGRPHPRKMTSCLSRRAGRTRRTSC